MVQSLAAVGRQGCCDSNERERLEAELLVAAMGDLITVGLRLQRVSNWTDDVRVTGTVKRPRIEDVFCNDDLFKASQSRSMEDTRADRGFSFAQRMTIDAAAIDAGYCSSVSPRR